MLEDLGRETAEVAGLGVGGELDHVLGIVAEHGKHGVRQGRAGADAVIGKQRLLEQIAADAGAAALVADLEPPAANGARLARLTRHIGGAGAEDRHGAIAGADRAFERDLGIGLDSAFAEGQDCFQLLPVGADIGASEAKNGRRLRDQLRVLAGGRESLPCRLDDVGARAGEIGADVGRAAFGAPDDIAVGGRKGGPTAGAAAIDAKHEFHAISPRPG